MMFSVTRWTTGCLALTVLIGGTPQGVRAECRLVTDFSNSVVGEFPSDWKPKEAKAREIYRVLDENGLRFVRATAQGTGLQMGREFEWDLTTHPVLTWKWRPSVFPNNADERQGGRNDSALGVYAVFSHTFVSVKTVKYVWSLTVPVGTTASASKGLTQMLVLRSGKPSENGWLEERVNVARDYERLFGEAPKQPRGIAILTDADDTKSRSVGDYAAFRVCPSE